MKGALFCIERSTDTLGKLLSALTVLTSGVLLDFDRYCINVTENKHSVGFFTKIDHFGDWKTRSIEHFSVFVQNFISKFSHFLLYFYFGHIYKIYD